MTPGCTIESQTFRDYKEDFEKLGVRIFGLSKDNLNSHEKFCQKESLNFPLLSDEDSTLIEALGSWVEKSMFGKKYMGIDRSTFVIKDGVIAKEWRKVKITNHVKEVFEFCQSL
jgi:peroxiredoxin Q/BCP